MQTQDGKQQKVYEHKLVALAFIKNREYILINHKDGDKENNTVENLEFSDHSHNAIHALETGLYEKPSIIYHLTLKNGKKYIGTIKELSEKTKIPTGTLYDNTYQIRESRKIKSIYTIGQQTIERVIGA